MSRENHTLHDEILLLRRQLEQANRQAEVTEAMRFTLKEVIVLATGTLFAFAGILVENEILVSVFLGICGIAYLYICIKHPGPLVWRCIVAGAVFVCFTAMMVLVHLRELKKQQEDVSTGVHALVTLPPSKNNTDSTFTIINDSHYAIGSHTLFCEIIEGHAPHTHFSNTGSFVTSSSSSPIQPGGDAETSACLRSLSGKIKLIGLAGGDTTLTCMDILVGINYSLIDQPKVVNSKIFRFISQDNNGYEWLHLRRGTEVSPCHVEH